MPNTTRGELTPRADETEPLLSSKGLVTSLSEGVQNLLVLDEKLGSLGREGDRARADVKTLQEIIYRLLGRIDEMDKRIVDRFADLDKRLTEMDRRMEMTIELSVRKERERRSTPRQTIMKAKLW